MNNSNVIINAAAYCRVSTDDKDQLHSLSAQIKYFTDYIGQHEGYRLKEVYYDEGITGTSTKKRINFNRMIDDAERGQIDLILTKEVSRFARNTVDTLTYTRRLSAANVGVIFTNDGIDTRDKDGELRLTIMASIAQEESRKTSERVKWGLRRRMEEGVVLGGCRTFGFNIENGVLSVIPEEAEIIRRIFNAYAYENKGGHIIAKELNADGIVTAKGYPWSHVYIVKILKHEKYVGDLKQAKRYVSDFLTKEYKFNKGELPFVEIPNHHEAIIDRETWEIVQRKVLKRGELIKEGQRFSSKHWYSSKIKCGVCGSSYLVNSNKLANKDVNGETKTAPSLLCFNRRKHGATPKPAPNGKIYGCTAKGINERVITRGMSYVLDQIQSTRDEIVKDLLKEIKTMQAEVSVTDTGALQLEIENIDTKKRNAIDLMLEGLISKDDLKKQTAFYDKKIVKLTEEIHKSKNVNYVHDNQIIKVKEYVSKVKSTSEIIEYNTDVFGELLDRAVINEKSVDFYLHCVPFGFRVDYRTSKSKKMYNVFIDSCTIIE